MAQTTTLPKNKQSGTFALERIKPSVKVLVLPDGATTYDGGEYIDAPELSVDTIIRKIGSEPSEATLSIPVEWTQGTERKRARSFKTFTFQTDLCPVGPRTIPMSYYTKVKIYYENANLIRRASSTWLMFVGYVSKMQISRKQKQSSQLVITLKDARWLMKKAPLAGVVHWDAPSGIAGDPVDATFPNGRTQFIKMASHMAFNMGRHPNMWYSSGDSTWWKKPRFCESDYNRTDSDGNYIEDGAVESGDYPEDPISRKWLAGPLFNYVCNMHMMSELAYSEDLTGATGGSPSWWDNPSSVTVDDLPVSLRGEVYIALMKPTVQGKAPVGGDWYVPRSFVGTQVLSGKATSISSVGEYSPWAAPCIDVLQDLCYRMGNYTLAATYSDEGTGRMVLHVIRTTQAFNDTQNVSVGLNSTEALTIVIAGAPSLIDGEDLTIFPDVHSLDLNFSAENLYNVWTTRGGRYWAQMTFLSMGLVPSTDTIGQWHPAYNPAGTLEHRPRVDYASILPGWTLTQMAAWLKLATAPETLHSQFYEDVFRTFLLNPYIDWPDMWGVIEGKPGEQALGYRRNFRQARQMLASNVTSFYQLVEGAFRRRRQKMPTYCMRSFRGTRTDVDGHTRYGTETTEATPTQADQGPKNLADFFLMQSPPQPIADDGRTGVRHSPGARSLFQFTFEAGDTGKTKSPLVWNGVLDENEDPPYASVRWYEMMLSITVPGDEELFEYLAQTNNGIPINAYGFRAEKIQDGGAKFQEESAINSVIHLPNPGRPPLVLDPPNDSPRRVYTDGQQEITARGYMGANKFFKPDIDGTVTFLGIAPDIDPGTYVEAIAEIIADDGSMIVRPVNCIVSSIVHNFQDIQDSTVEFGSIR